MDARAVDADEDAVRHRGPRGVLAAAVEAYLRGEGQYVNDVKSKERRSCFIHMYYTEKW